MKAMVPLIVVVGAMTYLMYLNGQDPMAMLKKVGGNIGSQIESVGASITDLPSTASQVVEGGERTFYKWRDAQGAWHYGEQPPTDAFEVKAISLKLTDNQIPAYVPPADPEEPAVDAEESVLPKLNPYSPSEIKQLFEDAEKLKETLNQRQQSMEGAFSGATE